MSGREDLQSVLRVFERRARSYDGESPWMRDSRTLRPLVPAPFGGGVALDLAAGTGLVGHALHQEGWSVVRLDVSLSMLLESTCDMAVVATATETPFRGNAFDLIVCRQALHYLDLPHVVLEVARLGARELRVGQIVAPTLAAKHWWELLFRVLAPGRRRVFMAGEVEEFGRSIAPGWSAATTRFSLRDSFDASFRHLTDDALSQARRIVAAMPAQVREAIDFHAGTYRQDWEVVVARCPT